MASGDLTTGRSITLVGQGLTGGGAELLMLRLAEEFANRGYAVRVAVLKKSGELLSELPNGIPVDEIGGSHVGRIFRLARYLRRHRTDAVISFMTYTNVVTILAQLLSLGGRKVVVSEHNAYTISIGIRRGVIRLAYLVAPRAYRLSRAVIAVSNGVADDLAEVGVPRRLLHTVYNPVITENVLRSAEVDPRHPWLDDAEVPVIVAAGRLERQKNYPLLLAAFAKLRQSRPCRLIILGEGSHRERITAEIGRLRLTEDIALLGYRTDAIAFMKRADAFVLTSDWEGLSNVLIEALAVGCPVVTTDAPHGPREVVQGGRMGRLVPTGDAEALAKAIAECLSDTSDPSQRMAWGRSFTVSASADKYLAIAGLTPPTVERAPAQSHRSFARS